MHHIVIKFIHIGFQECPAMGPMRFGSQHPSNAGSGLGTWVRSLAGRLVSGNLLLSGIENDHRNTVVDLPS